MGPLTKEVFNESCCDGGATTCNQDSAQPCGCDPKAGWTCAVHTRDEVIDIPAMRLREIASQCYKTAYEHGFHNEPPSVERMFLLAIGELVEAQNELRDGHGIEDIYFNDGKPEGFGIELADAVIRLLDTADTLGLDIEKLVALKMNYNEGRPYKHGKQF